jgi:phage tail sheath protein FI
MPVTPTYPGVYVEEIPSGVHTITGVATSIAAFVGFFREGPMNKAVQIFGMGDFNRIFGGLDNLSEAGYAVSQFFLNGGTEAHVIRVVGKDATHKLAKASIKIKQGPTPGASVIMKVAGKSEGVWGNNLRVVIGHDSKDPAKYFNLSVTRYQSTDTKAVPVAAEKHLNLAVDKNDTRYFVKVIEEDSSLITAEHDGSAPDGKLPASCGTFSGEIALTDVQIKALKDKQLKITIDEGATTHEATLKWDTTAGEPEPASLLDLRPYLERAIRQADTSLAGITVDLIGKHFLLKIDKTATGYTPATVIDVSKGSSDCAEDLKFAGAGAGFTENVQEYVLGAADAGAQTGGEQGADGMEPGATELIGDKGLKTGLYALEDVDMFNILCIPRVAVPDFRDSDTVAVVSKALEYCDSKRAFMIIDIPGSKDTVEEIKDWLAAHNGFRSKNAALYFPRVKIPDPVNEYRARSVGSSGTMAGLYARIDSTRGVWKAPAGTEASLKGVISLDFKMTDPQNGTLNPLAINCLREFPVYGITCWGARTLDGSDQQASEWKYIPVRRLALYLEESLFRGTKWVVFEPNDEPLWAKIRMNVGAFMMRLFKQGAFQGSTPEKAFFVKCDEETTPQADRDLGIVNIIVGFAPLKPAEFVIIKIQQIAGEL